MTSFRIHQVSLSMDKRLSRGGGRRLPDFCLSSTRPMPYFPRSWLFVLYLVALFQKCPRFFLVPCPVICLACVLAGPDWLDSLPLYMLPLSEVVKKFSTHQLQSLPSPPPLIHAAPTSVARFAFRRLTRNLMPKTDLNLEAWLHFGIHTSTLSFQRIPFKWAKAKTQNNLYWGSVERGGSSFIIFLITLNFHSASFKGNDFVCFLKLENKIWAYRRQTASTINSALQIHVLKLQLRRKCKKY